MRIQIRLSVDQHYGEERLFADFPYNKELISILKSIPGCRWSQSKKKWHFFPSMQAVEWLEEKTKGICLVDSSGFRQYLEQKQKKSVTNRLVILEKNTQDALMHFQRWLQQKRYSPQTIKNYMNCLYQFFTFYSKKPFAAITVEDVENFNYSQIIGKGMSVSFQQIMVGAIKLFYKRLQGTAMNLEKLQRPHKESRLPEVLSKEEVQNIIGATNNLKHKAMLSLIYACGLRRSEIINLRVKDLDSNRKLIRIEQAKGKKDRYVTFSPKLRNLLADYYKQYKPEEFLFEGQFGRQYAPSSLAQVLQMCATKADIKKKITLHTLRHSYATHLLESGTDIRYIQELLGHNSPKTTMIYTHVSSKKLSEIISPFDDLKL
ncbi:MAG TPA: tyrosine-type recombinase/integrase [Chitinophagaceae bacterium]|nr:tyrosine-type recombinase/integrase [Chitinophagaceae bacterium]MCB9056298.1 tyrosine-type recombinase/integrase [Chitinophagales bacterium]HPG10904.1 tyrosine-type recombinase/integrase [Chitinophagaceae bacterium]